MKDQHECDLFASSTDSFFLILKTILSKQHLYTSTVAIGSFDSTFGTKVIQYISKKLPELYSLKSIIDIIQKLFDEFLPHCKSRIVSFYILQGFIEMPLLFKSESVLLNKPLLFKSESHQSHVAIDTDYYATKETDILSACHLKRIPSFLSSSLGASVFKTQSKVLISLQLRQLLRRFADASKIEFYPLLQTMASLFPQDMIHHKYDIEFISWLFKSNFNLQSHFSSYLSSYFVDDTTNTTNTTNTTLLPYETSLLYCLSLDPISKSPLDLFVYFEKLKSFKVNESNDSLDLWWTMMELLLNLYKNHESITGNKFAFGNQKEALSNTVTILLDTSFQVSRTHPPQPANQRHKRIHLAAALCSFLLSELEEKEKVQMNLMEMMNTKKDQPFLKIQFLYALYQSGESSQDPIVSFKDLIKDYFIIQGLNQIESDFHLTCFYGILKIMMKSCTTTPSEIKYILLWGINQIENCSMATFSFLFDLLLSCLHLCSTQSIYDTDIHLALKSSFTIILNVFGSLWKSPNWTSCLSSALPFLLDSFILDRFQEYSVDVIRVFQKISSWAMIRGSVYVHAFTLFISWIRKQTLCLELIDVFAGLIIEGAVYGPCRHELDDKVNTVLSWRTESSEVHKLSFLKGQEEQESQENQQWNFWNRDYIVRVQINCLFLCLPTTQSPRLSLFLVHSFLDYLKTNDDFKRPRFLNSVQQRKAVRAWQSLHILFTLIQSDVVGVMKKVWWLLKREKCMETVYIIEWFMMRLVCKFPILVFDDYVLFLEEIQDESAAQSMSSLLIILLKCLVTFVDRGREEWEDVGLEKYVRVSIDYALIWMSNKNYTLRVFAQMLLMKSWNIVTENSGFGDRFEDLKRESRHVSRITRHLSQSSDVQKTFKKTVGFFFYHDDFRPDLQISVEFLFRDWGEMVSTSSEEGISCRAFLKILDGFGKEKDTILVPLGLLNRLQIRERVKQSQSQRVETVLLNDKKGELESEKEREGCEVVGSLFSQRKILPWEKIMEAGLELNGFDESKRKRNPIQIIASLISKPANLGGLCRTSETFNCELMTVPSLAIQKDAIFQNLCVTSNLWMPLLEIKPEELREYLLRQKEKGYTLIGIEQATNSTPLQSTVFPLKTCLVLGREKEGLLPELLAIMDIIVEIPQFGLIKSLNVHVSGSLVMWEYIKQQIASGNAT